MTTADAKTYLYDGKCLTIKGWANELGVTPITLYKRIAAGWPTWKVFGQPVNVSKRNNGNRRVAIYDGEEQTIAELAKKAGKPYSIVLSRVQNGWPIERALTEKIGGHKKLYTAAGKSLTREEWAREIGVDVTTITGRLYHGWPLEKALTSGLQRKPAALEYCGETHSMAEWGRKLGLSRATISLRLKSGWSIGDALTAPLGWVPPRAA